MVLQSVEKASVPVAVCSLTPARTVVAADEQQILGSRLRADHDPSIPASEICE